jgi:hypothetical protein
MIRVTIILLVISVAVNASNYKLRKYNNVKQFYKSLAPEAIDIGLKYNVPPATILAIAGLESGYGSGYIAQITGNILSLGAMKGDDMLPALYLPYSKTKESIIFDKEEIKKHSEDMLEWKKRDPSYKDDYRPAPYAGTAKNLAYLKKNPEAAKMAKKECLIDFSTNWISYENKMEVFKHARVWLDEIVKKYGKEALLSKDINIEFINKIGGHKNSFNHRKTWPKKVEYILKNAGLIQLCKDIEQNKMSFKEAWKN